VPNTRSKAHERPDSVQIQAIAISILGLYLIAAAFPKIVYNAGAIMLDPRWNRAPFHLYLQTFTSSVLELVMGFGLFLRAKGVAIVWHRLRTAGRPDGEVDPPNRPPAL
jgi:hypothetical protein